MLKKIYLHTNSIYKQIIILFQSIFFTLFPSWKLHFVKILMTTVRVPAGYIIFAGNFFENRIGIYITDYYRYTFSIYKNIKLGTRSYIL